MCVTSLETRPSGEDRYNKAKAVHRVLRQVAEKKGLVLKELYRQVGWPLYKK